MTADAQSALRRTMEIHSKVTRFCLICNYVTRIIEPLASRCAKFRFRPLTVNTIGLHLKSIAEKEGADVSDEVCVCACLLQHTCYNSAFSLALCDGMVVNVQLKQKFTRRSVRLCPYRAVICEKRLHCCKVVIDGRAQMA